jgi:hypothetical protein
MIVGLAIMRDSSRPEVHALWCSQFCQTHRERVKELIPNWTYWLSHKDRLGGLPGAVTCKPNESSTRPALGRQTKPTARYQQFLCRYSVIQLCKPCPNLMHISIGCECTHMHRHDSRRHVHRSRHSAYTATGNEQ